MLYSVVFSQHWSLINTAKETVFRPGFQDPTFPSRSTRPTQPFHPFPRHPLVPLSRLTVTALGTDTAQARWANGKP